MNKKLSNKCLCLILAILLSLGFSLFGGGYVYADDGSSGGYLSTEELVGLSLTSGGILTTGLLVGHVTPARKSLLEGPILFDRGAQKAVGGKFVPGKSNLWDKKLGDFMTTVGGGVALLAADLSWPRQDKDKDALQDLFLYNTGLMTTKGVTDIFKGIFARPRPYTEYIEEPSELYPNRIYNRQSFVSGHTSSAFFSMTFLNKRLRSIMRQEMSPDEYRDWRWLPPAVLYGWSTLVGWSRVHAYKHYPTDVALGAVLGYVLAEFFYSLADDVVPAAEDGIGGNSLVKITFTF